MFKYICSALFFVLFTTTGLSNAEARGGRGGSSGGGSSASKTVHVNGYTRKDGTHVREHMRAPSGSHGATTATHGSHVATSAQMTDAGFVAGSSTPSQKKTDERVEGGRINVPVLCIAGCYGKPGPVSGANSN